MHFDFMLNRAHFVGFDGDGDGSGAGGDGGAGGGDGGGGDGGAGSGGGKTYTQEEFDSHMAGLRRKYEEQGRQTQRELANQLAEARKNSSLSEEERTTLTKRIEELENQYLTDKEKSDRAAKQKQEEYDNTLQNLTQERDRWRRDFEHETVRNLIVASASKNKACDASQIAAIVGPMIEFKETVDEAGQGTGQVAPVVKFPDIDSENEKPITMEYTVEEAVKRMTELPQYFNLFEDTMKSGIGGQGSSGTPKGKLDVRKLASENPAEYRRLRREKPELLYGSMER